MTLIGLLVGITILSIALSAQIRLLGSTMRREVDLRNLIVATNLAREGIEITFAWRVTDGWEKLKELKGQTLCSDIRLGRNNANCQAKELSPVNYVGYAGEQFSEFKAFLYENPVYAFNISPFWRTMEIESCDDNPQRDDECLLLIAKVGWDKDKEVQLKKTIYNWYVP